MMGAFSPIHGFGQMHSSRRHLGGEGVRDSRSVLYFEGADIDPFPKSLPVA